MKKFIKKLSAAILSGILALGLAVTASAADPDSGSLTVTKKGSTFSAYKILSATKSGDVYDYTATANFTDFFGKAAYGNITIDSLSKMASDGINTTIQSPSEVTPSDTLSAVTKSLQQYIEAKGTKADYTLNTGVKTTVGLGYYLVVESQSTDYNNPDKDMELGGTPGTAAVASKAMLVTVPYGDKFDVAMYPKDDGVTISKKIVEGDKRVDTNTIAIGDDVKYEIISTIPTYDSSYDLSTVKYKITDTMSQGLTYNNDAVLTMETGTGTKPLTEGVEYTTSRSTVGTNTVLVWNFDYSKIMSGTRITVTLSGKVNDKAVIGAPGNPNQVTLDVTNNTGENHIADKVISYTYELAIRKVDAENVTEDLAGAEFSLKNSSNQVVGRYTYDENGKVVVISGNKVTTDDNGMVYFAGLNAGTYKIVEEKAPAGYKLLGEPVEVTITGLKTGEHYNGKYTVTIANSNTAGSVVNNVQVDGKTIEFVVQIKNYEGLTLPSTGGMGTNVFCAVGLVLIAAGIFFVSRKLKRND